MGALASGVSPTGSLLGDALATVGLTVAVVAAASIASSWAWVLSVGTVAVSVDDDLLLVAGALVVLVIAAGNVADTQRRLVGAVVGAAVVQLAVRLPERGATGVSALIATAAFVPLVAGGWALARTGTRQWVTRAAGVTVGVWAVAGALFGLAALVARNDVERGVQRAEAGLAAARRGDTAEAAELLEAAERAFASADATAGAWWTWPARIVPIVGHQGEALDRALHIGRTVADAGADSAGSADLEGVRLTRGRVDLDAVGALAGPLRRLDSALRAAQADLTGTDSPWLVAPIADRLERLRREIDRAAEDAEVAALGVAALPELLGGDRPVHYLVLFATAAESRPMGGLIGAYAEIVFDDGTMSLVEHGNVDELNDAGAGRTLTNPNVLPDRYLSRRPDLYWQQIAATADLPTVAEASRQLWPQSGGETLDGVIYIDSAGVAALLELTGPVSVGEPGRRLSADTADDFLLRELYNVFPEAADRDPFVEDALVAVFDALAERSLPGPEQLGEVLGPAAARDHLAVYSFDDTAAEFLRRVDIDGALPPVDGGDFLSLRWDNVGPNKADPYLERAITYEVDYDPATGQVEAVARIELDNGAPPTGLPSIVIGNNFGRPPGTNLAQLALHSPLGIVSATVDGEPATTSTNEEYGRFVHGVYVEVPSRRRVVVEITLSGEIEPSPTYRLRVSEPAAARPATLQVTVNAADTWADEAGRTSVVGARFRPDSSDDVRVRFSTT